MQANRINCTDCPRKNCLINKYGSPKWKSIVDDNKTTTLYKKGQQIFKEGNTVFGVFFVRSGKVKIFNSGLKGKMQIVRLARSGEIIGHRGFGGKLFYPIGAASLVDSQICFIENEIFFNLLKANLELTFNLMLFYADELKKSEIRMRNLTQMRTLERIVEALFLVGDVFGKKEPDDSLLLDVPLTRQEIADIAGTTQEQVIRTLSEFKKNNLIFTKGKQIFIKDFKGMSHIIAEYPTW